MKELPNGTLREKVIAVSNNNLLKFLGENAVCDLYFLAF